MHKSENEKHKILLIFEIQMDHLIPIRRSCDDYQERKKKQNLSTSDRKLKIKVKR